MDANSVLLLLLCQSRPGRGCTEVQVAEFVEEKNKTVKNKDKMFILQQGKRSLEIFNVSWKSEWKETKKL